MNSFTKKYVSKATSAASFGLRLCQTSRKKTQPIAANTPRFFPFVFLISAQNPLAACGFTNVLLSKRRLFYYLSLFFILFVLCAERISADPCIDCHTNPKYRKEDAARLKECLACHGSAGHPYKEARKSILSGEAHAAVKDEIKSLPNPGLQEMILIPAGEFIMGTDDRLRDEKPAHVVYINAFYIDRFEVTNEDYRKFVEATNRPVPDNWTNRNYPQGYAKHPVIFVDWNDANAFCRWAGKRLPREAEWEKAGRGTDGRIYPWGDKWDMNKSNNPLRGHEGTMPVGSFESGKSPYGLYDMSGNVWEWVDEYYFPHPGSDYTSPEFGKKYRLLKGGSWWDCMFYGCGISAPMFNRSFFDASTKNDSFGFRCAADAKY